MKKIFEHLRDEGYENMGDRPWWKESDQTVEVGWKAYHQRRVSAILVWSDG